jgi:hypothetical protein
MPWSLDAFSDMADFGGAVQTEMTKGNPILSLPRLFPCGIQLKGGISGPEFCESTRAVRAHASQEKNPRGGQAEGVSELR